MGVRGGDRSVLSESACNSFHRGSFSLGRRSQITQILKNHVFENPAEKTALPDIQANRNLKICWKERIKAKQ